MDKIKLHDLKRISTHIKKDLDKAYHDVMEEGNYLRGASVAKLLANLILEIVGMFLKPEIHLLPLKYL